MKHEEEMMQDLSHHTIEDFMADAVKEIIEKLGDFQMGEIEEDGIHRV